MIKIFSPNPYPLVWSFTDSTGREGTAIAAHEDKKFRVHVHYQAASLTPGGSEKDTLVPDQVIMALDDQGYLMSMNRCGQPDFRELQMRDEALDLLRSIRSTGTYQIGFIRPIEPSPA